MMVEMCYFSMGPKDNHYLLMRKTSDDIHEYPGDCGAWGRTGTSVNFTFINHNGKLKSVFLKNTLFCTEKMARVNASILQ